MGGVTTCKACETALPPKPRANLTRCGHPLCAECFAEKSAAELDALGVTW